MEKTTTFDYRKTLLWTLLIYKAPLEKLKNETFETEIEKNLNKCLAIDLENLWKKGNLEDEINFIRIYYKGLKNYCDLKCDWKGVSSKTIKEQADLIKKSKIISIISQVLKIVFSHIKNNDDWLKIEEANPDIAEIIDSVDINDDVITSVVQDLRVYLRAKEEIMSFHDASYSVEPEDILQRLNITQKIRDSQPYISDVVDKLSANKRNIFYSYIENHQDLFNNISDIETVLEAIPRFIGQDAIKMFEQRVKTIQQIKTQRSIYDAIKTFSVEARDDFYSYIENYQDLFNNISDMETALEAVQTNYIILDAPAEDEKSLYKLYWFQHRVQDSEDRMEWFEQRAKTIQKIKTQRSIYDTIKTFSVEARNAFYSYIENYQDLFSNISDMEILSIVIADFDCDPQSTELLPDFQQLDDYQYNYNFVALERRVETIREVKIRLPEIVEGLKKLPVEARNDFYFYIEKQEIANEYDDLWQTPLPINTDNIEVLSRVLLDFYNDSRNKDLKLSFEDLEQRVEDILYLKTKLPETVEDLKMLPVEARNDFYSYVESQERSSLQVNNTLGNKAECEDTYISNIKSVLNSMKNRYVDKKTSSLKKYDIPAAPILPSTDFQDLPSRELLSITPVPSTVPQKSIKTTEVASEDKKDVKSTKMSMVSENKQKQSETSI